MALTVRVNISIRFLVLFLLKIKTLKFNALQGSNHLERPWKSFNFKIKKIQGLESPWELQQVPESQTLNCSANLIQLSKLRKTFRIKLLMWWKNSKRHRLKALFCTHWIESLKMGNVSLKVLKMSLNFLFKNRYEPWHWSCPSKNELGKHKFGKAVKFCHCDIVLVKNFFFAMQASSFMYWKLSHVNC